MIGFVKTKHNLEQKIPNCAPHFAQCVVHIPWHIFKALHEQLLFCITAAVTASLLSSSSIIVCLPKFVPVFADCLDFYGIISCHLTVPGIDSGHFAHVLVHTLLFLAQTQLQTFHRVGNLTVLK